jgi:hypothetical protein
MKCIIFLFFFSLITLFAQNNFKWKNNIAQHNIVDNSLKEEIAPDGNDEKIILLMGDNNIQLRERPEDAFKYLIPFLRKPI